MTWQRNEQGQLRYDYRSRYSAKYKRAKIRSIMRLRLVGMWHLCPLCFRPTHRYMTRIQTIDGCQIETKRGRWMEGHHLSYQPEIVAGCCRPCHINILHSPKHWIRSNNPEHSRNTYPATIAVFLVYWLAVLVATLIRVLLSPFTR